MQHKTLKTILSGAAALLFAGTASADYYKLKKLDNDSYASVGAVSKNATVALRGGSSDYAYLASAAFGPKRAGDKFLTPLGVNDSGTIIGIAFDADQTAKIDYAFLTPKGGSSQLILTAEDLVAAAINDSNVSAVTETTAASFFNGTALAGTISLGANQEFGSTALMLSNGKLLTIVRDAGTPHYALVSLAGGVTMLSQTILPAAASIVRETSTGSVFAFINGTPIETDLVHAPVKLDQHMKDLINIDSRGHLLFTDDGSSSLTVGFPESYSASVSETTRKASVPLICTLPKAAKVDSLYVLYAAEDGTLISRISGRNSGTFLLTPTGEGLKSFCADVKIQVVGSCAKGFPKGSLSGRVKDGSHCQIQIQLNGSDGKPLSGRTVATSSYPLVNVRGKTDKHGRLVFSFKAKGYTYLNILAPYGDKVYQTGSNNLSVDTF